MTNVILIGDSIRMSYQPVVRRELAGAAEVWGPEENGGDSENVLAHLEAWVLSRGPALVHLNCGLHDLKTPFDSEQRQVPLDRYRGNLEQIFRRITEADRLQLIWATITPVNQHRHHEARDFDRFERDVTDYNAAARHVARQFNVPINDLHALVEQHGRDELLGEDGVHFTETGQQVLGQEVANFLRPRLPGAAG